MRTITIKFDVPEKFEDDYADVDAEPVFEDFFNSEIGFSVVNDTTRKEE